MALKQLILVRQDLKMSKGKAAAQACHASVSALMHALREDPKAVDEWLAEGQPKIVLKVRDEKELISFFEKLKKKFPCSLITDAGRTQIAPGTKTCLGVGPAEEKEIDKITKDLKLL